MATTGIGITIGNLGGGQFPTLSALIPSFTSIEVTSPSTDFQALTTSFVPAPSCASRYYAEKSSSGQVSSGTLDPLFKDCQPSQTETIFSPGMCPELMATVNIYANESIYTEVCCQSGFSWDYRGCSSAVSTATVVFVAPWTGSTAGSTTVSSVVATHQAITVLWKDADLTLFPSDVASRRREVEAALLATTGANHSTSSSSSSKSATDLPNASTASMNGATGLSRGARIGIGVGAAAGGILMLGTVSALLLRGRRRKKESPAPSENENENETRYELDTSGTTWKRWVKHAWRAEVSSDSVKAELAGNDSPVREAAEPGHHEKRTGTYDNNGETGNDPVELPA